MVRAMRAKSKTGNRVRTMSDPACATITRVKKHRLRVSDSTEATYPHEVKWDTGLIDEFPEGFLETCFGQDNPPNLGSP